MAEEKKSGGKVHWLAWLILIEIGMVILVIPQSWLDTLTRSEAVQNRAQIGRVSGDWVEQRGAHLFEQSIVATGILESVRRFVLPTEEEMANSRGMQNFGRHGWFPYVSGRLQAVEVAMRRMFSRLVMFYFWLPIAPLVVIPAVFDGMMTWRKRQYSFDYASPLVHGWAAKCAVTLTIGAVVALLWPTPVPALAFPMFYVAAGVCLQQMTAHTQKRI